MIALRVSALPFFCLLPWLAHSLASLPPLSKTAQHFDLAQAAMEYLDASPDPFHAVLTSADLLKHAGFSELTDFRTVEKGGKYFYTRNKSTLVAFSVGPNFGSGSGFTVIGGHTDSPNLRIKPRSKRVAGECIQLGVECYGGGLWHTWFDRDLGLSGRVLVRNSETNAIEQKLVKIDRALCRISNLAIHLQTSKEREAFKVNKEDHLSPILAMEVKKALEKGSSGDAATENSNDGWTEHQEPALLQVLANELNVPESSIVDFELCLFDIQKANLGGAFSEFLHSARLDNLASCFMAVRALMETNSDSDVSMIVLYDHEEVGSGSATGAASPILTEAVKCISESLGLSSQTEYNDLIQQSFCLSSDQAHALHPNYVSKHEKAHQPRMNAGMVIKRNANQRYATNAITGLIVRQVARKAGLPPVQEFIVRQDCGCGSTIGPIISAATGIRTIDMGCPQLSMHSIRETMGVCDLTNGLNLFKAYFAHFREVDSSIQQ